MHQSENLAEQDQSPAETAAVDIEEIGHPKGTLAILAIYMLLFVAGWIGLYFFLFLSRGATSL